MNKLLNTMMWSREWPELKARWEKGEHLAADFDNHLHYFKLVSKYSGMRAETRTLKKIFMRSFGPAVISAAEAVDKRGKFRDFRTMVRLAAAGKAHFGSTEEVDRASNLSDDFSACLDKKPGSLPQGILASQEERKEEGELAAVGFRPEQSKARRERRPRRSAEGGGNTPKCFFCGKGGHIARNCWKLRMLELREDNDGAKRRSYSHRGEVAMTCAEDGRDQKEGSARSEAR